MSPPTGIPGPLLICATVIRLLYSGRAGLGIGLFKFLFIYLFSASDRKAANEGV